MESKIKRVAVGLVLVFVSSNANATNNENFLGSFSGPISTTFWGCTSPSEDGTIKGTWSTTNFNLIDPNYDSKGSNSATFDGSVITHTITGLITGATTATDAGPGTLYANGVAIGWFGFNSTFDATGNSGTITTTGSTLTPGGSYNFNSTINAVRNGDIVDPENSASNVVTTTSTTVQAEVVSISSTLGARIQGAVKDLKGNNSGGVNSRQLNGGLMFEADSGLAAGDTYIPFGLWTSYSHAFYENDFAFTAFEGDRDNIMIGVDISPWERTIFGVALGYEFSDTATAFNRGDADTTGVTIAPYFGALLSDVISVDAMFGYSFIDTDQFRRLAGSTARITSDVDSKRWFIAANLNGNWQIDNWLIGFRTGVLSAENSQDAFRESDGTRVAARDVRLSTISVGGNASYFYKDFEPFVSISYQNDISFTEVTTATASQPANDDDDILFGMGIRYYGSSGLTASFDWQKRLERDEFDEDALTFTIRGEF